MADVRLPVLGDFMLEGTLVEWLQPDGARVEKGALLYRLETDKVSLEVEAPASGVLHQVVGPGTTVPVNGLLGQIAEAAASLAGDAAPPHPGTAPPNPPRIGGELAPAEPAAPFGSPATGAGPAERASAPPSIGGRGGQADAAPAGEDDVRASPAARRLARELSVDLAAVAAANRGIRLREEHVQAFAAAAPASVGTAPPSPPNAGGEPAPAAPAPSLGSPSTKLGTADRPRTPPIIGGPGGQPVPLAGRRRVIAQRMHQSLQQMAQLTLSQQVDVTECARLREQLVRLWEPDGVRPTYTDFVVRAAALALREHPALNATLEDDALVQHATIDVGLAVDAPEGLIVPVLRGADGLGLRELARRTAAAAEQARANRLGPDELHGGTFTVTTLGGLGIDFFTPIVNPPQVAIIGIGRVFPQLALVGGQVVERQAMYLNLSFDHRALDGAPAARFLNRVKELLELPVGLL